MPIIILLMEISLLYVCTANDLVSSISQPSLRSSIDSFKVMDVLARANKIEESGRHICHMEAGQPSTSAPLKVLQAASEALKNDRIGYTNALGIPKLRKLIAEHYKAKYGVEVSSDQVIVTSGSSAAFLLCLLGCFDPGSSIAIASSGYPCYRNIMTATNLNYISIPVNSDFKVTAVELRKEVLRRRIADEPPIKGLILSSPSNPTGAMLSPLELKELVKACEENNVLFLSDEIYHGISYGDNKETTALEFSNRTIVINSFSKYFSMTGWRIGWMIVPHILVDTMNRLTQNIYINAPTISQLAACEAFQCTEELDAHVRKYAVNRDIILSALQELGFHSNDMAPADGAFYIYIDLSKKGVTDSPLLCQQILEEAGVAFTPGSDFEDPKSGLGLVRMRISFCRDTEEVIEGMGRFKTWWFKNYPFSTSTKTTTT